MTTNKICEVLLQLYASQRVYGPDFCSSANHLAEPHKCKKVVYYTFVDLEKVCNKFSHFELYILCKSRVGCWKWQEHYIMEAKHAWEKIDSLTNDSILSWEKIKDMWFFSLLFGLLMDKWIRNASNDVGCMLLGDMNLLLFYGTLLYENPNHLHQELDRQYDATRIMDWKLIH